MFKLAAGDQTLRIMMYSGRAMNFDFFGTSFDFLWHDAFWQTTSGQGTPGHNKLTLRDRFPWMTKSDAAWLRMALKLYNGFEPTARELRKVAEANDRGLSTGASDGNNTSEQQMRPPKYTSLVDYSARSGNADVSEAHVQQCLLTGIL